MNKENKQNFLIVDAYNILYRAFHANPNFLNSSGTNIGAVYTAFNMIWSCGKYDNIVVVFDGGGDNFRKEIDSNYKSNRSSMPEDLKNQIPIFKEALNALDIKHITPIGVEADDLIGSIAVEKSKYYDVTILSSDKDFRQILNDNIIIYDSMNKISYTKDNLKEKMGIEVNQVIDYLSLVGDNVDNVSGVEGIGKGTALKLLNEFGSIDNIYAKKGSIKFRSMDNFFKAYEDGSIKKAQSLISLDLSLFNSNLNSIENTDITNCSFQPSPDSQILNNFINKYNFNSWRKKSLSI